MIRTNTFLGFSVAERSHRRILVASTYFVLGALMVLIAAASANAVVFALAWVVLAWNIASGAVLGRLVANTAVPQNIRVGELLGLGLARRPRDPDELDERDIAVRNAACFRAYRVIGMYALILVLIAPGLGNMATIRTFEVLLAPLLAMAVTLPQAIVLWSEPNVPAQG